VLAVTASGAGRQIRREVFSVAEGRPHSAMGEGLCRSGAALLALFAQDFIRRRIHIVNSQAYEAGHRLKAAGVTRHFFGDKTLNKVTVIRAAVQEGGMMRSAVRQAGARWCLSATGAWTSAAYR
jgi:hypothetical protein